MAFYCDDPKPYGKLTRKHIYALPGNPFADFNDQAYALSNPEPGQPALKPAMRAGNLYLYDEYAAEAWIAAMRVWIAGAKERREAKRKAEFEEVTRKTADEMARLRVQNELLRSSLEASEQERAARAEWEATATPIIQSERGRE